MFGNEPISSTPLSSLRQVVLTYLKTISYVTTVASNISNRAINKILAITTAITLAIVKFISVTKSVNTTVISTLNKVTLHLKTLTVTVLNTISLLTQRIVHQTLSVVVSNVILVTKAIAKIFSTIHDTMIIVLTSMAFHLVGISVLSTVTPSVRRTLSKTITLVGTVSSSMYKLIPRVLRSITTTTNSLIRGYFRTLSVLVNLFKNGCQAGIAIAGLAIAGDTNNVTLNARLIRGYFLTAVSTITVSLKNLQERVYSVIVNSTTSLVKMVLKPLTIVANTIITKLWNLKISFIVIVNNVKQGCIAGLAVAGIAIAGNANDITLMLKVIRNRTMTTISNISIIMDKGYKKLLTYTSIVTSIALRRLSMFRTLSVTSTIIANVFWSVITKFGAVADRTYFAYERMRTIVLVKVRTIFANKGDKNG